MEITPAQLQYSQEKYIQRQKAKECGICYKQNRKSKSLKCGHLICSDCLSHLESCHCPFCRSILTPISASIKNKIHERENINKNLALLKDQVTSQYLARHPKMDVNLIYSALIMLDNPLFLLELSPSEIRWLISNN